MRPGREHATNNGQTYFVTSSTYQKRSIFQATKWCELFIQNLYAYRGKYFDLHEFVLMRDHFHLLITPAGTLERAGQTIKGGFSYKAKREFATDLEIWQVGFGDHRIRDAEDYRIHQHYIFNNPVKKGYCVKPEDYLWSSASGRFELDPAPQRLKPLSFSASVGAHKCAPLQRKTPPKAEIASAQIKEGEVEMQIPRCSAPRNDKSKVVIKAKGRAARTD